MSVATKLFPLDFFTTLMADPGSGLKMYDKKLAMS